MMLSQKSSTFIRKRRKNNILILYYLLLGFVLISFLSFLLVTKLFEYDVSDTVPTSNVTEKKYFYHCKELRYRPAPLPKPVALVSFPGSGNTWLRHLLQESTGILTGSIHKDDFLFKHNFPAEAVEDGSVLVVKMHKLEKYIKEKYYATVLLIRKPRDTILADFNRFYNGPNGTVSASKFKLHEIELPNLLMTKIRNWYSLYSFCLGEVNKSVYIVFYEHLVKDTKNTLKGVLKYLNQTVSEADLDCAIAVKEGAFLRKERISFDPFPADIYKVFDEVENEVMGMVKRAIILNKQTMNLPV